MKLYCRDDNMCESSAIIAPAVGRRTEGWVYQECHQTGIQQSPDSGAWGFAGDYEVVVALANGAAIGRNLHVTQDGANSFTIRLPSPVGGLTPAGLWSLVVIYV